ncbi:katanin p60 ATPase-containing subunit A-like 2 [Octopus vulgaris]|uniref:Katanin p60 ATPase-containing subunit A-like 2 n=1 Tax=Octopus vulgaris TaxID=6645 RepID=A0AA36AMW0_OCTVU|nr:katanin p60 ATPase-containing subunit A-like 2 [Octopus vulgaris]
MSTGLSYQGLRCAHQAREAEELKTSQRRKNLLILIIHYLTEQGYRESADCLTKETNIDVNRYETCDNIDLETILMDFENYYHLKFSKYPKLTKASLSSAAERRAGDKHCRSAKSSANLVNGLPQISGGSRGHISPPLANPCQTSGRQKLSAHQTKRNFKSNPTIGQVAKQSSEDKGDLQLIATNVASSQKQEQNKESGQIKDRHLQQDRLLKPLGGYMGYNNEWRDLAQLISREIYVHNPNLGWNDIIGLDEAKRLVKEAVVYPIKYPSLFKGILSPWKGLLLYGPPGTGKTLLAKAVATECDTTFFNISASSIVSKWRGDSEKLVRVLFELARFHAPSTIFLDELDSLMSQRGSNGQGVELDNAMLRRLEKRILVGLPKKDARQAMFNLFLPKIVTSDEGGPKLCTDLDYDLLAEKTEGYSGSDIKLVCKEAAMRPMRKIFDILENEKADKELNIQLDTLTTYDVEMALERTKPSARGLVEQYAAWQKEFESV